MAKTKTRKTAPAAQKSTFDTMSVTVLLVMAIFGGIVGFHLGKGATSPQAVSLREAATLLKEKGMMMEDAGRLMSESGKKNNDRELMDKGQMMTESGNLMVGKGEGMMNLTKDY